MQRPGTDDHKIHSRSGKIRSYQIISYVDLLTRAVGGGLAEKLLIGAHGILKNAIHVSVLPARVSTKELAK